MRADLHSHSTASDGTCPPAEVMRQARAAGLDVIALTDHDTVAGHGAAAAALPPGLTLLPGMELSCRWTATACTCSATCSTRPTRSWPRRAPGSAKAGCDRARAMVERLAELGVPVTWEQVSAMAGGGVVGRPHIARAMAEAGVIESPDEAFGPDWIGAGGRAHVARYALDPARAIALIRAAGGVTVLAHPRARGWLMPDEVIAGLAAAGLSGIEVWHPDQDHDQRTALQALAARLGLVASGGSDDHGELTGYRIGSDTIAPDAYERLIVAGDRRRAGERAEDRLSRQAGLQRGRQVAMEARIERAGTTVNSWIVGDDEEVIVVDPGSDAAAVLDAVGEREVLAVICTHGHAAHAAAAVEVAARDEAPVALHPRTGSTGGRRTRSDNPEIDMEDGGIFEVADVSLEVLHAPGPQPRLGLHLQRGSPAVFAGDVLSAAGPVPHEKEFPDFARQLSSIGGHVLTLPGPTRVLPGHGDELTVAAAEKHFDSWVTAGPALDAESAGEYGPSALGRAA